MADVAVATYTGTKSVLREVEVEKFKASLRGELVRPADDTYDDVRRVWNYLIDKRPALIARCSGVSDVISCVDFARSNSLLVAIRGGGHNIAGSAVCDDGLMIDLSPMKSVRVDPVRRLARAEPGVTWGEFDRETQAFGLAATGGVVSMTGIAGLTLGGGVGWLVRKCGLSCDSLLSVDIVTADGKFLTASATENSDLFWAVRGGGGNFGIVTSFEYRLHPVGPIVLAGAVAHPFDKAREVLKFYREYASDIPDELTTLISISRSPEGDPLITMVACYCGPIEEGEEVIRPLRDFGSPVVDMIKPMPYRDFQSMRDQRGMPGPLHNWKDSFLYDISDSVIDAVVEWFPTAPSPQSAIIFPQVGGVAGRIGKDETAFYHRDMPYDFAILSMWSDPSESERNLRWSDELWKGLSPSLPDAVYVNDLMDEGEDRVKAAYGGNYQRLVELKNRYDPTNFFRLNQNIKPMV